MARVANLFSLPYTHIRSGSLTDWKSMDYVIDTERLDLVLDKILDRYRKIGYPYNLKRSMLSVLKMPVKMKRGGEAEARFWLFSCMLMRGGINTDTALKAMSQMYDLEMDRQGLQPFNPSRACRLTTDELTGLLKEAGTGLYRIARDWIEVARLMTDRYDGKVMNLLDGIHDYDSSVELLINRGGKGLPGFQHKMVSMFLFFLTETGLLDYFPYPPPVDFHLQRVPIETLIITRANADELLAYANKEHDELQRVLREMYLDYIARRKIRSNELADAVWLLSRMLCRWNPGNTSYVAKERDGTRTTIIMHEVDFSARRDIRKYERSCARCPVEEHCERNVPANPYYVRREIGAFGLRKKSPIVPLDPCVVDGSAPPPKPTRQPKINVFQNNSNKQLSFDPD